MKSFSIRFSTKMPSHPQAEQMRTDDCDCYRVVVQSCGFHLSPVTAWTRPDSACSESLSFEILLLEKSSFQSKWRFLNFPPKIFQNFDENFIGTSEHIHNHKKYHVVWAMSKFSKSTSLVTNWMLCNGWCAHTLQGDPWPRVLSQDSRSDCKTLNSRWRITLVVLPST